MVQSSLIVPGNSSASTSQKRSTENVDADHPATEETKRPRLDDSEAGQKRNRRLFGALLGTLNKFRDDTEKNSQVDKNRQKINEKLHEKLEMERKELADKLRARKEEKLRLQELKAQEEQRILQEKAELSKIVLNEKLANFLKTSDTEPALYYLPAKLTDEMIEIIQKQRQEALEARKEFERKSESRLDNQDVDIKEDHNMEGKQEKSVDKIVTEKIVKEAAPVKNEDQKNETVLENDQGSEKDDNSEKGKVVSMKNEAEKVEIASMKNEVEKEESILVNDAGLDKNTLEKNQGPVLENTEE